MGTTPWKGLWVCEWVGSKWQELISVFEAWLWQYRDCLTQDQAALSPSLGLSEDYQAELTCSQLQIPAGFTQILHMITQGKPVSTVQSQH